MLKTYRVTFLGSEGGSLNIPTSTRSVDISSESADAAWRVVSATYPHVPGSVRVEELKPGVFWAGRPPRCADCGVPESEHDDQFHRFTRQRTRADV